MRCPRGGILPRCSDADHCQPTTSNLPTIVWLANVERTRALTADRHVLQLLQLVEEFGGLDFTADGGRLGFRWARRRE